MATIDNTNPPGCFYTKDTKLRECSYDPTEDLITISYDNDSVPEKYLEVKYRIKWFNIWCQENGKVGRIEDADITIVEGMNLIIATASIFVDNELIAKSSSSAPYIPGDNENNAKVVQNACTSAKGRALANAGFGTISSGLPSEEGDLFPVDSGIRVERDPSNPMRFRKMTAAQTSGAADNVPTNESSAPVAAPKTSKSAPKAPKAENSAITPEQRIKDAYNFVVPMGEYAGKTLSYIMGVKPDRVEFYAEKYKGNNTALVEAARTVLSHSRQ